MKILLTAATVRELEVIREKVGESSSHQINFLVTGVGIASTLFTITEKLSEIQYNLAINIGIAGAFDRSLELGEVVEIKQDRFSEELIEDGDTIRSYEEVGLRKADEFPFKNGNLQPSYSSSLFALKKVTAITVNTVHGNETSIQQLQQRLNPQIESMEGAAFFYACHRKKQACIQLRAISNYVEKRNRKAWKVDLALNNLAEEISHLIQQL